MTQLSHLQKEFHRRLAGTSETPGLDSQVLIAHLLNKPRTWVLSHPEAEISPEVTTSLFQALGRLERGEPLPYVLGHWEFFGLDFFVSPAVLIPRPETETLVEYALRWLSGHPSCRWILDVGTGTGCIAISLLAHNPNLRGCASDISPEALQVAHQNIRKHRLSERILCVRSNLIPPTNQPFDLICANLPYIPSQTLSKLAVFGREPTLSLDGGEDGLQWISKFLQVAPEGISPSGLLLLEIEASQGDTAYALAKSSFPAAEILVIPDLSGRDRLLAIHLS